MQKMWIQYAIEALLARGFWFINRPALPTILLRFAMHGVNCQATSHKKMPNPAAAPFVLGAAALSGAAYYYNNNRRRSSASSLASSDGADLKTYNVNYNPAGNAQQQTTAKPYFSETHPQYGKDLRWAQDATRPGSWKWV